MKKKLLFVLFLCLMSFGIFGQVVPSPTPTPTLPCRCTGAPPANQIYFDAYSYTAGPGEIFSTKVLLSIEYQLIGAYGITIGYDPAYLSPVKVVRGDLGLPVVVNDTVPGVITTAGFDPQGKGAERGMSLLEIQWEASNLAGNTSLDITVNNLITPDYRDIYVYSNIGASVKIESCILGDVNGDGIVNIIDALWIAQKTVGLPIDIVCDNYDVNGDGAFNIIDALIVAQYYVGLIPSLPV